MTSHHLKKSSSSSNGSGISNNNYYGFSSPSSQSDAMSNCNGNNDLSNKEEAELAGGGLSFVIHSPSSHLHNHHHHHNNNQIESHQDPSITSCASSASTSSGISSGSSTITKSSAFNFNGNTFTRSKPKERKPLPDWQQQDGGPSASALSSSRPLKGGPFHSPQIIPTLTLSAATPTSSSSQSQSPSNSDSFYFNSNSNNSSSTGSVVQQSKSNSFHLVNGNSNEGINGSVDNEDLDNSAFQPSACSTFILTEGEEFPERERGAKAKPHFFNHKKPSSSGAISNSNSVSKVNFSISNGNGEKVSPDSPRPRGITKMKTEKLAGAAAVLDSPSGSAGNFTVEEENFECLADGTESFTFQESSGGSGEASLQYSRDGTEGDLATSGTGPTTPLSRNSWTRTSLRNKSPQSNGETMGYRRWGSFRNASGTKRTPPVVTSSNALANQLYRSSSFHSSGRSSAGDAEEMYSDGSLEDEVIDLTHKVHHLEEKMNVLAENQSDADDRYTREKEKNAELSTKVFMLEEQLRETEMRSEEKLREEQRRLKEFQSRWDREKQLQSENYEIRLQSLEKDLQTSRTEGARLKSQVDRERSEKINLGDKVMEMERELGLAREENRALTEQGRKDREKLAQESAGSSETLLELKRELEGLRQFRMQNSPTSMRSLRQEEQSQMEEEMMEAHELKSRLNEFEEEIKRLKRNNQNLQDSNDELNAQLLNRGLEEGRTLLTTINSVPAGDSLAAEFEAMSQDQHALGLFAESETDLAKVKKALKEQVEVNEQLRAYIDGILLIIVENNPQLLEVKNNSNSGCNNGSGDNNNVKLSPQSQSPPSPPSSQQQQQPPPTSTRLSFGNSLSKIAFRK